MAGGADIIDVKEPSRGALGAADVDVWHSVCQAVAGRVTTSAALGELTDGSIDSIAAQTSGFAFAKIGLAGCAELPNWRQRWQDTRERLPAEVQAVPVAYADWRAAQAPAPLEVLTLAAQNSRFLVFDTFHKSGGSLLDYLPLAALREFLYSARALSVQVTLAGSLTPVLVADVVKLRPAYIGVRGAACRGGRQGTVEQKRVQALASLLPEANVRLSTIPH
jgi:uncharacterized protein (UPF0264 family)